MTWTTLRTLVDAGAEGVPSSDDFVEMPGGAILVEVRAKNLTAESDVMFEIYRRANGDVDAIGGITVSRDQLLHPRPVILQVFETSFDLAVRVVPRTGTVSGVIDARIVESY